MKYTPLLLLAFAASAVNAEEAAESKLSGSAELGYVITSGNTETSTLNGKLGLTYDEEVWKNTFNMDMLRTKAVNKETDEEETTAKRLIIADQYDYKFSARGYGFLAVEYDKDDVSEAYDHFINYSAGYGRTLIKEKDMGLSFELGLGLRDTEYESLFDETLNEYIKAEDTQESFARVKGNFSWQMTPTAKFTQLLKSDIGLSSDNGDEVTLTRSESALLLKINSKFAMKTSYIIEHRSKVAEGVDKEDTKLAITLVYSI